MSKIMARSNVNQDDIIVPLTNKQGQILTPEFYVVGSLCGGSGAGMFLDMAYLLKMAYYQLSGGKGKPTIVGIQLTPEAFTQISIDLNVNSTGRIEGNGYASLVETFYFMNKEKFPPTRTAKDIISQTAATSSWSITARSAKATIPPPTAPSAKNRRSTSATCSAPATRTIFRPITASPPNLFSPNLKHQLRQAQNSMLDNASQILGQNSSDLEGKQLKCFSSAGFRASTTRRCHQRPLHLQIVDGRHLLAETLG